MRPDRNTVMAIISAHDGVTVRRIAECYDRMAQRNLPLRSRIAEVVKDLVDPNRHLPTMGAVYTVCCRLECEGAITRDMTGRWRLARSERSGCV